jgi:hypothetical protein
LLALSLVAAEQRVQPIREVREHTIDAEGNERGHRVRIIHGVRVNVETAFVRRRHERRVN